jgi:hypothetical protein
MMKVIDKEGQEFSLYVEILDIDSTYILFAALKLKWMTGLIKSEISSESFHLLNQKMQDFKHNLLNSILFISDFGNLEFCISGPTSEKITLSIIAIPDMTREDKLECKIVGWLQY